MSFFVFFFRGVLLESFFIGSIKLFWGDTMNLLFDEESQKIIKTAKREMSELKHPYVGSEHLLLAILKDNKLEVTKLLNKYGIFYDEFKDKIITVIGIGKKNNNWFLFTPLLKRILNVATYTAKDQGKCVTPFDLVTSIISEGDGVANRILISMNIDIDALYDKLSANIIFDDSMDNLLLDKYAINMNEKCFAGTYDPVIGRENEVEQLIRVLSRKNKNNPLLVGEAGVGKTAIVEELVRKITLGLVPDKLKEKKVYSLSMSVLISGTKYRGEFEEKFHKIIDEILTHPNVILFIDEIHTIIGAGGAEGAIDASNIVKPYLARGEFQVIGATTIREYEKYINKDKAFARRFQKIMIYEPKESELKNILMKIVPIYEKYHSVFIPNEIIDKIINFSNYYFSGKQPDKMIDLLDEVCSYCEAKATDKELINQQYLIKIKKLEEEKNKALISHDFKLAMSLKEKEKKVTSKFNTSLFSDVNDIKKNVTLDDLYNVVYDKLKLPLSTILNKKIKNTKKNLLNELYDPDNNIEKIFKVFEKSMNKQKCVPISILLVGKSGSGKTFLAEKISKMIFDDSVIKKINISNKANNNEYIFGTDTNPLLNSVIANPFRVFIIEGLEKTATLYETFNQIFKTGTIINNQGETLDFKNCIFLITYQTNNKRIGFNDEVSISSGFDKYKKIVSEVIELPNTSEINLERILV